MRGIMRAVTSGHRQPQSELDGNTFRFFILLGTLLLLHSNLLIISLNEIFSSLNVLYGQTDVIMLRVSEKR